MDHRCAEHRDEHVRLKGRIEIAHRPARHPHEAEKIKREERGGKSKNPQQGGDPAQAFVEAKPEGLGKPVMIARQQPEQNARYQGVVKMGHQKQRVGITPVNPPITNNTKNPTP
jgi:hypothetical protein